MYNVYIYIYRRGHPQSAAFSLFSYTCADSSCLAHLQWLCHYCATIDSFCLAYMQWLNKTKNQEKTRKTTKTKGQNPTLCHYSHLGMCNIFFSFFVFLVSVFFFGFCFSGSLLFFLKGWQNNTKVKDLDLTLRQFSHFRGCKLAFDCVFVCFGHVVPLEKHEYLWQNAGITWGNLGLGTQIRQFCLFM